MIDKKSICIIGGAGHELEEQRREAQVVLGVLTRELTDAVAGGALHAGVRVLELLLETRERRPQGVRVLEEHLVHDEYALLTQVRTRRRHLQTIMADIRY